MSPEVIEEARAWTRRKGLEIPYCVRDLYGFEPKRDGAELIVCCEVLEHLDDPEPALEVLTRLARPWLILSVPRESLWRTLNLLRESNVRRLGNTPGHLQHWSKNGFIDLLSEYARPVEVRSPMPWTMVLAESDRPQSSAGR